LAFTVCHALFPNHTVASLSVKRNDEVSPGFDVIAIIASIEQLSVMLNQGWRVS
jgi:hypothetical protein